MTIKELLTTKEIEDITITTPWVRVDCGFYVEKVCFSNDDILICFDNGAYLTFNLKDNYTEINQKRNTIYIYKDGCAILIKLLDPEE